MGLLHLLMAGLTHNRLRAALTLSAVAIAFVLLGLLASVWSGLNDGGDSTDHGATRLVTLNKASFIQPLPLAHGARIAAIPGVVDHTHVTWVGAFHAEPRNAFSAFAVDADSWLRLHPEYTLDPTVVRDFANDRGAALVGTELARSKGWKTGDRIVIGSSIYLRRDGSRQWPLRIAAVIDSGETSRSDFLIMHYAALNEARAIARDSVGWFVVATPSAAGNQEVANAIDAAFANSPQPTSTVPERIFFRAFAAQYTELTTIVTMVGLAALVAVLMVVATTQAQAVLERRREFAVFKAIGFSGARLYALVTVETCVLFTAGAMLGLAVAAGLVALATAQLPQVAPQLHFPWLVLPVALLLAPCIGVLAALVPAARAARTPVALAMSEG